MKMHALSGGRLRMKKRIYVPDADRDETIELPVSAYLFRHASGNVLFDTGCHPSVETDAEARWGGLAKVMTPIGAPRSDVVSSLDAIGLSPEDIDLVVNSHFHPDHCGCNAFFATRPSSAMRRNLPRRSRRMPPRKDTCLPNGIIRCRSKRSAGSRDIFGDDKLVTIALPGHTAGMIGLRAALERSGEFLLASDAVSLKRNLDNDEIPRNAWNADLLLSSYAEIRRIEKAGATVLCGHDDLQWQALRKGADAYE